MKYNRWPIIIIGILINLPIVNAQTYNIGEPTLMGGIILGLIFLGFILAFLATKTSEEHSFLRLFFFFLSLLVITISINIMFISCNTYMATAGICELVGAYSNNMTYVFMYIPLVYFIIYFIYTIFTNLKQKKNADIYQQEY